MRRYVLAGIAVAVVVIGCSSGGGGSGGRKDPLELPGSSYYPESLSADSDGTLYVGSLAHPEVVKFAPGSSTATVFLSSNGNLSNVSGVFVDQPNHRLYLCAVDISGAVNSSVRVFDLDTAVLQGILNFGTSAFCNDFAFDGSGNLYVTDSFGRVWRLATGTSSLALWTSAGVLAPSGPGNYGADGITFDGQSAMLVGTFTAGKLYKIPIEAGGAAGTPVEITVTPPLSLPDGIRLQSANSLLVAEGAGRLTRVLITGSSATATALETGLDGPTSVIKTSDGIYVTEGQLNTLFTAGTPNLPFKVRVFPKDL